MKGPARPCNRCGYDLRAAPNRCPECGLAVSVSLRHVPIARSEIHARRKWFYFGAFVLVVAMICLVVQPYPHPNDLLRRSLFSTASQNRLLIEADWRLQIYAGVASLVLGMSSVGYACWPYVSSLAFVACFGSEASHSVRHQRASNDPPGAR